MSQKTRSVIFCIAALLVLSGAALFITHRVVAPYLFAVGAAGMAVCTLTQSTSGMEFRERRLYRFNVMASILMVCASGFMFKDRKEWVICLTIAAILMLYASFVPRRKE